MSAIRMNRRQMLGSTAAATGLLAAPAVFAQTAPLSVWKFGSPQNERAYFEQVNGGFGGSELNVELFDWDARQQRMASAASSDQLPDVALIENSMVPVLADEGVLLDLNEVMPDSVAAWRENFIGSLYDLGKYDGGFYGFSPYVDLSPVILCNSEMFNEAGLAFPTTWEELLVAAETLNQPGRNGIVFGASGASLDAEIIQSIAIKNGARLVDDAGNLAFAEGPYAETMQLIADLLPFAPPGLTDLNFRGALQIFFQNRAAMVITKSFAPIIQSGTGVSMDFPSVMIPFPSPSNPSGSFAPAAFEAQASFLFTVPRGANVDAARAYLDYWAQPENQMGWNGSEIPGRIPTAHGVLGSAGFAENYPSFAASYQSGDLFDGVISVPAFPEYGALRSEITRSLQGLVVGQYDPARSASELATAARSLMTE